MYCSRESQLTSRMLITFGDFDNEISELIESKDPLGLNTDTERYQTAKSKVPLQTPSETKMEEYHDVILHYLKSAVNVNNSADTDQTTKTSPTLQVNIPNISISCVI